MPRCLVVGGVRRSGEEDGFVDGRVDEAVRELFVEGALDGLDQCVLGAEGGTHGFEEKDGCVH